MGTHIEWVTEHDSVGIVRAGKNLAQYGDPYEFTFVVLVDGDTAHLVAGSGAITQNGAKEVLRQLANETQIKYVTWERRRKNAATTHIAGPFNLDNWRTR